MNIGYQIVEGVTKITGQKGFSFRIRGVGGRIIVDCPLWFKSPRAAKECAEHLVKKAIDDMRQKGVKAKLVGT